MSEACKNIMCTLYDGKGNKIKEAGIAVVRNGTDGTELVGIELYLTDGSLSWRAGQGHIATLAAAALKGNYDITDAQDDSQFIWTRESADSTGDKNWNSQHSAGSKTLPLGEGDMSGDTTSFVCTLYNSHGEAVKADKIDFKL